MQSNKNKNLTLTGKKGGKAGGGAARVAVEDANTLQSKATARIVDLLCEGPIEGLVDGYKSVYIDDTPLQAENGNYNFLGINIDTRDGLPQQSHLPGFADVRTENTVDVELFHNTPVVRTISDPEVDAIVVKITVPRLTEQNKKNGDLHGSKVDLAIDVRNIFGNWTRAKTFSIDGKTTSTYTEAVRVDLPSFADAVDVAVVRLSEDTSNNSAIQNQTYWSSYTAISDAKLTYPNCALVGIEVDSKQFNSIPSRHYLIKGLIVDVPDNYDPETRVYTGQWTGNFKKAWTNNPAWVLYDFATNTRYGAGIKQLDKWSLYNIARYNDELVDDGFGGQEPRFTFNSVIAGREDAYSILNKIASTMRCMLFWGTNTVVVVQDRPRAPTRFFGPASVTEDGFSYSSAARKAIHTIAKVSYNEPAENYKKAIERVDDTKAIQTFGINETQIDAFGCTSRGQANRLGKWLLYTERDESETIQFTVPSGYEDLEPGEIVNVSDPHRQNIRVHGRIRAVNETIIEIDAVPELGGRTDWQIYVLLPSGLIEVRDVVDSTTSAVIVNAPFSTDPARNATWSMQCPDLVPDQWRIMGVKENSDGTYGVNGIKHNPNKYAEIEQGLKFDPPNTTLIPTGRILAPLSLNFVSHTYTAGGTEHQALNVSWTPADDARVTRYEWQYKGPFDRSFRDSQTTSSVNVTVPDIESGRQEVRVRSISGTGTPSPWTTLVSEISSLLEPVMPSSIDLEEGTFSVKLFPNSSRPDQDFEFWRSSAPLTDDLIESNATYVGTGIDIVDTNLQPGTSYYYYVRGINIYGYSDFAPAFAQTNNDGSAVLTAISGEIKESDLFIDLQTKIQNSADQSYAIIEVEQKVNDLEGQYTIKVQSGSRVSGIGLMNDGTTSAFAVLADSFYISDPDDALNEVLPFIVQNGKVYIHEALIADGTIDNAKLGVAAVDTANIKYAAIDKSKMAVASIGTAQLENAAITAAKIGDAEITIAKIAETLQSTNFISGVQGWRILKSGAAEFNDIVISRPNIVASGTWVNPNSGSSNDSTAHINNRELDSDNFAFLGQIDTGYNNLSSVHTTRGPSFTARVKCTNGHHWYFNSGPGSALSYRALVHADIVTGTDMYTSGTGGTAGGRIYLRLWVEYPANLHPDVYAIRIDQVQWSLSEVT